MTMFTYICLFVFWAGAALLMPTFRYDIKARIKGIFEKQRSKGVLEIIKTFLRKCRSRFYSERILKECIEILGYIKNISILGRLSDISADVLFSELSENSDLLRPVFEEMARYLSVNDKASAKNYFRDTTDLPFAIGELLSEWDDIAPSEIVNSIDAYRSVLSEELKTVQKKRDELISDLIFFPVVFNCLLVLMNFVYIAYFLPQKEMLTIIF